MKKRTLIAACLLAGMSVNAQNFSSGIDKKNMNLNVKPGTDFYQYAAGGWLKSHPLDAEHTSNGAFVDLFEENQKRKSLSWNTQASHNSKARSDKSSEASTI